MRKRNRTITKPVIPIQNGSSPAEILNDTDPGDETQRRFRYQHAYGVILLTAAACGNLPYKALWCEHHEDFLGERDDGLWDAYQIKTQKPENGAWNLQKIALRDSIKRFVVLNERFPGKIYEFRFVSNCSFFESDAQDEISKSPIKLLQAIRKISSSDELETSFSLAFEALCKHCDCTASQLLEILKKLQLVVGPGLPSFDAELAHDHLPNLPNCKNMPVSELIPLRDELVALVYRASSLTNPDSSRHWSCINGDDYLQSSLRAKTIPVSYFISHIRQRQTIPFRYLPGTGYLELGQAADNTKRLHQKMIRGGVSGYFDSMRQRALSAEYHLLELAQMKPEKFGSTLNQLVGVVKGECDEAHLIASMHDEPFGQQMLVDVHQRLKGIAENRPNMVDNQEYECLVGVAGLLSGECKIWWSKPFELEDLQ